MPLRVVLDSGAQGGSRYTYCVSCKKKKCRGWCGQTGGREGGREGLRKAAGGAIDLHASHSGL